MSFDCPLPIRERDCILLAHGSGGRLGAELVERILLPAFRNPALEPLDDQAVLPAQSGRLAFTTDSYVVTPLFFPGGDIGELAVNGTVNDLAMGGARPIALSESTSLLSAVGNDGDFARVFVDQIDLLARPHDVLLGISTSGASSNVTLALRRGRELGLFTIGFAGRDGGAMVDLCDVCLVVPSWSIHRIQEVHTLLLHLLWDELHVKLGADDVL